MIWLARQIVNYIRGHASRKLARPTKNWQEPLESDPVVPWTFWDDNREVLTSGLLSTSSGGYLRGLLPLITSAGGYQRLSAAAVWGPPESARGGSRQGRDRNDDFSKRTLRAIKNSSRCVDIKNTSFLNSSRRADHDFINKNSIFFFATIQSNRNSTIFSANL